MKRILPNKKANHHLQVKTKSWLETEFITVTVIFKAYNICKTIFFTWRRKIWKLRRIWAHTTSSTTNSPKPSCSLVTELTELTVHATLTTGTGVSLGNGHERKQHLKITNKATLRSCTAKYCMQEEKHQMRAVNFATLTLEWQHFVIHKQWSWRWAQASPHGRSKPDRAKTKTLDEEWEVGLHGEILTYAMHSGECSTCPLNYSVQNGSNDIVVIAIFGTTNYCQ